MSTPATCFTLDELARRYRTSKKVIRADIKAGKLEAMKIGRSWVVSPGALRPYELACLPDAPKQKPPRPTGYTPSKAAIQVYGV